MKVLVYRLLVLIVIDVLISACTTKPHTNDSEVVNEAALRAMLSAHDLKFENCEHIFIVSQYQCKGCVDRILPAMVSESLRPVLESSSWFAPYQKPSFLDGYQVHWNEVNQTDIEKIIPYAANINYVKLEASGISKYEELGVKWTEVYQLERLFK